MNDLILSLEEVNKQKYESLQLKFETYQRNVATYIEVKESNRNTISIVFDASDSNQSMINESIIKLYLSKVYKLTQDKIQVLSTNNFVKEAISKNGRIRKQDDEVVMTKILVEIVEDRERLEAKQATIKADINDGSSLLFDLMPSYMCYNLG